MKHSKAAKLLLFFVSALVFMLAFSKSTSPLYHDDIGTDSAIFMLIGKGWANGVLPYVGLWDLKGPVIFAINALGWLIAGNWYGLFAIQVLFMFLTLFFVYKMLRTSFPEKEACILTVLSAFLLRVNYTGNSTEEYLLPLLCLSFWKLLESARQFKNDGFEHNPAYAFIYGITFSFSLLTRLTNALGLCGAVLVMAIGLVIRGKWKNLLQNAMSFIAGVIALAIPFLVYFSIKGALWDLFYGTIGYNLDYFAESYLGSLSLLEIAKYTLRYGISAILPVIGLAEILDGKENYLRGWMWICSGLFTLLWLLNSNGYEHYGMVAFPFFAISLVEIKEYSKHSEHNTLWKTGRILLYCFFCAVTLASGFFTKEEITRYVNSHETEKQKFIAEVLSVIPPEDMDSFVAYNTSPNVYLFQDIQPCYRFFTLQDKHAKVSKSMMFLLRDTFSEKKAKWILFKGNPDHSYITDIINSDYTLVQKVYYEETKEFFSLYCRQ